MVLVHFVLVMSFARVGEGVLSQVVEFLDGRAAATFVVLAGVGLTLRSRSLRDAADDEALKGVRRTIVRRGLFLLAAGYLNLLIWAGDILRVYGVSLLLAAWFLRASGKVLWIVAVAFVVGFLVLILTVDYSANWDWETLEYYRLWTLAGAVRNLFYDGFRTVFPWTGLLFFGMWLGREDFREPRTRTRFFIGGLVVLVLAELGSWLLLRVAFADWHAKDPEEAVAVLGTASMPPMPLFQLSAVGTAVAVIAASIWVAERFAESVVVRALVATGQLAFTWYVGHIAFGLGAVMALGLTEDRPLSIGLATGAGFFAVATVVSSFWRRRFRLGPLEWLMRRVAG
jgi:uncharacterized membrane protein YeiB